MKSNLCIKNRTKLAEFLVDNSIAIIHSGYLVNRSADADYPFVCNRNSFYLTGINQDNVLLVLSKIKNKTDVHLFIEENDSVMAKWVGSKLTAEEASFLSGIELEKIKYVKEFDNFIFSLLQAHRKSLGQIETVYLDLDQKKNPLFNSFGLEYARHLRHLFPAITIKNLYQLVVSLRMVKEPEEVEYMKESIAITKDAIYQAMRSSSSANNEAIVRANFNLVLNCHDRQESFSGIVASGKNATILHYTNNNSPIEKVSLVLMDVGTATNHYASDITRTFPVSGKFTKRQKEVYEAVLEVNKKCINFLRDGLTWAEYNQFANNLIKEACLKLGLKHEYQNYYYHSIGHSLGLDVHDPALADQGIKAGMVITVEPGLYIEEEQIGVRIEDDVFITSDGCINLSQDIIKEVADIEKLMSK